MSDTLSEGDRVEKFTGDYHAEGTIRAVYTTYDGGPVRYMVAIDRITHGQIMHTLAPAQLRPAPQREGSEYVRADRIAALEAERARLREALAPFAADVENWADSVSDSYRPRCTEPGRDYAHHGSETAFSVGNLRRAAAALKGEKTG